MLQVVILGLLPLTLKKVAVFHVLIEQVTLIPVPISSGFLLLTSASSITGAVKQMTYGAASCSDRALIYRLRSLKALSWADQCPFGLGHSYICPLSCTCSTITNLGAAEIGHGR